MTNWPAPQISVTVAVIALIDTALGLAFGVWVVERAVGDCSSGYESWFALAAILTTTGWVWGGITLVSFSDIARKLIFSTAIVVVALPLLAVKYFPGSLACS